MTPHGCAGGGCASPSRELSGAIDFVEGVMRARGWQARVQWLAVCGEWRVCVYGAVGPAVVVSRPTLGDAFRRLATAIAGASS